MNFVNFLCPAPVTSPGKYYSTTKHSIDLETGYLLVYHMSRNYIYKLRSSHITTSIPLLPYTLLTLMLFDIDMRPIEEVGYQPKRQTGNKHDDRASRAA